MKRSGSYPTWAALGVALPAILLLVGCQQETSEERVTRLRGGYEAVLHEGGFFIREEPLEVPEAAEEDENAALEEEAQEIEETDLLPPPVRQDAVLDIHIRNENRNERLDGLTIDIVQADAARNEKGRWHVWVDTSRLGRGPGTQITHVLEDIDFEGGDGFRVEVRSRVPVEERAEYREYVEGQAE